MTSSEKLVWAAAFANHKLKGHTPYECAIAALHVVRAMRQSAQDLLEEVNIKPNHTIPKEALDMRMDMYMPTRGD